MTGDPVRAGAAEVGELGERAIMVAMEAVIPKARRVLRK